MGSEIEVPETPNWLQELEAKRERRLKARLGHETGAGAPCLKCENKCPGLDLHFWRKCCKICKCSKEEHEIQDDDIYGWAQFQLLGSKPNKIKRKIFLPGKNDALELDWAPKGNNDTVDKYLKTLPTEQLPVKGSQAAQDRKQLLQKQIPIHDIDPSLCHELTEDELKKMNEYIAHVKQSSVGVGQIVNLSSIIKGNLHNLHPSEAAIIASRYAKGIPLSEIVKLQSGLLSQNLEKLNLNAKNLPNYVPNSIKTFEQNIMPSVSSSIIHDVNYPGYPYNTNQDLVSVQFSTGLTPGQHKDDFISFNEKYPQNPNFDPKNIPSQFISQNVPYGQLQLPYEQNYPGHKLGTNLAPTNSAFVPYNKISDTRRPEEEGTQENRFDADYPKNDDPVVFKPGEKSIEQPYISSLSSLGDMTENVKEMKQTKPHSFPNYAAGKHTIYSDLQSPTKVPKNVKDLAFSTYDTRNENPNALPFDETSLDQHLPEVLYDNHPSRINKNYPYSHHEGASENYPRELKSDDETNQRPLYNKNTENKIGNEKLNVVNENYPDNFKPLKQSESNNQDGNQNLPYGQSFNKNVENNQYELPKENDASGFKPIANYNQQNPNRFIPTIGNQTALPSGGYSSGYNPNATASSGNQIPNKSIKKLSELQPGKIHVDEDLLQPRQVIIGAIQDINYPEIKAATHGTNDFYEDYSPDSIREILNNVKLPDCHYCKKPFEENEFAVTIDRANVLFHAKCFRCAGCNQILADNVYFYNKETDNIYCGRDYAKIRGFPRCKACDELIFTKEYCLAENSTFHLKHFCCIECDTPLAGQDYTLEDEMPYCLPCFEQSKANKCNSCFKVIKPDEVGCNLNGVHFHAVDECFACKMCKRPLMGKKLLLRNQQLYCSHECFGADKSVQ